MNLNKNSRGRAGTSSAYSRGIRGRRRNVVVTVQSGSNSKSDSSPFVTTKRKSESSTSISKLETESSTHNSLTTTILEESRVILALSEGRGEATCEVGLAAIDLTSPSIITWQLGDSFNYVNALHTINVLNPNEIILPITFVESRTPNRLLEKLKRQFPNVKIVAVARSTFNAQTGMEYIKSLCAKAFDSVLLVLQHRHYALSSTAALLNYVETSLLTYFSQKSLKVEYKDTVGIAMIDISTADELELVASKYQLASKKCSSLLGIMNHCATRIGARKLRSNILQPPCTVPIIEARLECIAELLKSTDTVPSIRDTLSKVRNINQLLSIASIIPENPDHCKERQLNYLILLNSLLKILQPLSDILKGFKQPFFKKICQTLQSESFTSIQELLQSIIHEDAHMAKGQDATVQRCFCIKPGINGLLDLVRKSYSDRIDEMREYVQQLSEKYGLDLTLSNNNKKGFHILMKLSSYQKKNLKRDDLPEEFIQLDRSMNTLTAKTLDLINISTRIDSIVVEILKLSNKLIHELLIALKEEVSLFYTLCEQIAELDMLQSLAITSTNQNYVKPKFADFTELEHAKHPLLDFLCQKESVPNSIVLSDDHNMHIITGPNGSGKSIFIRQMFLLQVMAQVGCYVPAFSATFRVADRMLARVSMGDNIQLGASSFVLEMKEINNILTVMTDKTLIIVDELCRSTSVEEGTAIAMAISEKLMASPAFILMTTHYVPLAKLSKMYLNIKAWQLQTYERVKPNGSKYLDFTHTLIPGIVSLEHYALYHARLLWHEVVMSYVDKAMEKLLKQKKDSAKIEEVDLRLQLKYDLESELKLLKRKKQLTLSVVVEKVLEYKNNLKELGYELELSEIAKYQNSDVLNESLYNTTMHHSQENDNETDKITENENEINKITDEENVYKMSQTNLPFYIPPVAVYSQNSIPNSPFCSMNSNQLPPQNLFANTTYTNENFPNNIFGSQVQSNTQFPLTYQSFNGTNAFPDYNQSIAHSFLTEKKTQQNCIPNFYNTTYIPSPYQQTQDSNAMFNQSNNNEFIFKSPLPPKIYKKKSFLDNSVHDNNAMHNLFHRSITLDASRLESFNNNTINRNRSNSTDNEMNFINSLINYPERTSTPCNNELNIKRDNIAANNEMNFINPLINYPERTSTPCNNELNIKRDNIAAVHSFTGYNEGVNDRSIQENNLLNTIKPIQPVLTNIPNCNQSILSNSIRNMPNQIEVFSHILINPQKSPIEIVNNMKSSQSVKMNQSNLQDKDEISQVIDDLENLSEHFTQSDDWDTIDEETAVLFTQNSTVHTQKTVQNTSVVREEKCSNNNGIKRSYDNIEKSLNKNQENLVKTSENYNYVSCPPAVNNNVVSAKSNQEKVEKDIANADSNDINKNKENSIGNDSDTYSPLLSQEKAEESIAVPAETKKNSTVSPLEKAASIEIEVNENSLVKKSKLEDKNSLRSIHVSIDQQIEPISLSKTPIENVTCPRKKSKFEESFCLEDLETDKNAEVWASYSRNDSEKLKSQLVQKQKRATLNVSCNSDIDLFATCSSFKQETNKNPEKLPSAFISNRVMPTLNDSGSSTSSNISQALKDNKDKAFKNLLDRISNDNNKNTQNTQLKLHIGPTIYMKHKRLTKREITESFNKESNKMYNCTEQKDIERHLKAIENRPSVKQVQQVEHLAVIRKTKDGIFCHNIENKPTKRKKFLPPLKESVEVDVSIFSDKNVDKFEEFMKTPLKNNSTSSKSTPKDQSLKRKSTTSSNTSIQYLSCESKTKPLSKNTEISRKYTLASTNDRTSRISTTITSPNNLSLTMSSSKSEVGNNNITSFLQIMDNKETNINSSSNSLKNDNVSMKDDVIESPILNNQPAAFSKFKEMMSNPNKNLTETTKQSSQEVLKTNSPESSDLLKLSKKLDMGVEKFDELMKNPIKSLYKSELSTKLSEDSSKGSEKSLDVSLTPDGFYKANKDKINKLRDKYSTSS